MNRLAPLLLLPVLAVGCGGGDDKDSGSSGASVTTTGAADAQTVSVNATDALTFDPTTINAKVGSVTLDVKNTGRVPHNLEFQQEGLGKTGTINGKKSEMLKVAFASAGSFTFVCTFHSGMTGKVVVS